MAFLDALDAADKGGAFGLDAAHLRVVRDWLTSRPEALVDDLRARHPTFVLGDLAFVTRFDDVQEVLARQDVFSVEPYAEAIRAINDGADFLLGLDDGPAYRLDLARLRHAFPRDDAPRLRAVAADAAERVVLAAMADGRCDLPDLVARPVAVRFVEDYIGVREAEPAELARWARAIFMGGFGNALGLPTITRKAMRAADDCRAHLEGEIAGRRAARDAGGSHAADTVLDRLLALQTATDGAPVDGQPADGRPADERITDAWIRNALLWLIAGMVDNVATAVCSALDSLLDGGLRQQAAVDAALAHDDALLWRYAREAMRFRTPTPLVTRRCLVDHALAAGTPRETMLRAGTLTFAGVGAAMKDATTIEAPRDFRPDRPSEQYLHFGAGLHECLGAHVAEVLVTQTIAAVLRRPGLRRAKGVSGRLRYLGPFPRAFVLECDAHGRT